MVFFIILMSILPLSVLAYAAKIIFETKIKANKESKNQNIQKKEDEHKNFVWAKGRLGRYFRTLNAKTIFFDTKYIEKIVCTSLEEYEKFNVKNFIYNNFSYIEDIFSELKQNTQKNADTFNHYKKVFNENVDYSSRDEIKKIENRKISIRKFMEIEKNIAFERNKWMKNIPSNDITYIIEINFAENKRSVCISLDDFYRLKLSIQREKSKLIFMLIYLIRKISEKKEYNFVCKNSILCQKIILLNKNFIPYKIEDKEIKISCLSLNEFRNFDINEFLKKVLNSKNNTLKETYEHAMENEIKYEKYKQEYLHNYIFLQRTDISHINNCDFPFPEKFQTIEEDYFFHSIYDKPKTDFEIKYKIVYMTPAERYCYQKNETINRKKIKWILDELEEEREEKRRKEERKSLKEIELVRRENELAMKESIYGSIEKKEKELKEIEKRLRARERDFFASTYGHIYAKTEHPVEHTSTPTFDEHLSIWKKLKLLRKEYEDGSITYQEYVSKRNNIL